MLSSQVEDVPDLFNQVYQQQKEQEGALKRFAYNVARYIKGFWCDILEEGLERRLYGEFDALRTVKKVSAELFDDVLPQYVEDNADLYPEAYQILKMQFQKDT